jgi:hypothetical protein
MTDEIKKLKNCKADLEVGTKSISLLKPDNWMYEAKHAGEYT